MGLHKCRQIMILSGNDLEGCPDKVKILPTGHIDSEKGQFVVDKESFEQMQDEMKRRGIDIVIDYEHQTLKDVQAPAGGWVKELEYTPEAIVAKVEWTPKAREYISNREYRYLSPVILTRKNDNKAVVLHSVALTNTPAINGMFAIANSVDVDTETTINDGGKQMDILQEIKKLLGLPADAKDEEVLNVLTEAVKKPEEDEPQEQDVVANSVILGLLGLGKDAKTDDVTTKIMTLKAGISAKEQEAEDVLKRLKERDADDAVMMALKAGKIAASQKEWAKDYALKDRLGFDNFIEKAPVVVPMEKLSLKEAPRKESVEVDRLILKATGLSKEDIEKYADKEDGDE